MRALLTRVTSSLRTLPRARDWLEALAGIAVLALLGLVTLTTGLTHYAPVAAPQALKIAAIAVFVPALGEELAFRSWLPRLDETPRPTLWLLASLVPFVLWHVVEAQLFIRFASIFPRPDFLAFAAALGLICAILRMRSGSIWPAVTVHWAVVIAWLTLFGGPQAF